MCGETDIARGTEMLACVDVLKRFFESHEKLHVSTVWWIKRSNSKKESFEIIFCSLISSSTINGTLIFNYWSFMSVVH